MEKVSIKGIDFLRFSKLSVYPSLFHVFSTRFLPLKLINQEDREQLSTFLNAPPIFFPKQIHGDNHLLLPPETTSQNPTLQADILLTQSPLWGAGILVADCVPMLVFDPQKKCFALAHIGWRGALLQAHCKAVRLLKEYFGANIQELLVGLGPSIKVCCFEVGKEVAEQFLEIDPQSVSFQNEHFFVNLSSFIQRGLWRMGIPLQNIEVAPWCTSCHKDLFYSFRREKEKADRMALIAWLNN